MEKLTCVCTFWITMEKLTCVCTPNYLHTSNYKTCANGIVRHSNKKRENVARLRAGSNIVVFMTWMSCDSSTCL